MTQETILKASASSNIQSLASAIAHGLERNPEVRIRAVGAGAVNQSVKALAVARGIVAPKGRDLYVRVGFADVVGSSSEMITALEFAAFTR